ncbi:TIM-barrel domain-containing protein [Lacinutrix sp. Hel_I_90]|uniref:glycoside hydrolase family 31 protein n=1 Tax=Lacinutrix sp. Hel_I_90 TaxID=1249999 RepID=UPI0005C81A11|nr:TIM-barrel domain-containing protein [Lacinutrix sp. Hel_I_90]
MKPFLKIKKPEIVLVYILMASFFSFAQNEKRTYKNFEEKPGFFQITVSDGTYRIVRYSAKILETTFIPKGETYNNKSHAVVLKGDNSNTISREDGQNVYIITDGIKLTIQKEPFKISYSYKGKPIISEKGGYIKNDSLETISFNLKSDEILYGGGARALGMNRRGHRLQLYNKAHYGYENRSELMNFTLPIVLSSNKYMMHFDNAPIGFLDLDSHNDNTLSYETISGRKTYQVIVGDSWLDLLENYTSLTGRQPLPPRWALGNFASRFGYHSQAETEATIAKFKEDQIPVDAVILDLYWFGKEIKGTMGNLQVHKDSFPDFKAMTSRLKQQGVKTITITEPFILTTSKRWQEAVDQAVLAKDAIGNPYRYDFYFGNTGLIDIYNPKGKAWFQNIYKEMAALGVSGVWGDLGEPEVHPSNLLHATGTADEVHNTYGHDWAGLVQEFYAKAYPNQRPFILMRSGAAGSQRFGMIPWSGDVNRTWGGLQSQTEIALQMGMQGLAYMHSDLGGFAGANLDDALYTRWLQYGVFQPIYRPHGQEEVAAEPVFRAPKAKALAKEAIMLRYKLLPYNYTLAFYNSQTGEPLMRPLFFEEADNRQVLTNASTYLWGQDFLVTPITQKGLASVDMYFPSTSNWFNFYTDEKVSGGQTKTIKTKENTIPTFVRGGAFIPTAKPMQSTNEYDGNTFDLHYYFDASVKESERELYNDDGKTRNAFQKGNYERMTFEAETKKRVLELEFEAELGEHYSESTKAINVIVHNFPKQPKRIKSHRKKLAFNYEASSKTLTFPITWHTTKELETKIRF